MHPGQRDRLTWLAPWGFALGAAALIGWLLDRTLPQTVTIAAGWASVAVALTIGTAVGVGLHLRQSWPSSRLTRPRLVLYKKEGTGLFVFSPAEWLSYRSAYTIFVREPDGYERLLCVAEVVIIQDDHNVQLAPLGGRAKGSDDVWANLNRGSRDHFENIIVKPGGPILGTE